MTYDGFIIGSETPIVLTGATIYNRSQILENRTKWINFLLVKGRKKAKGALDIGGGSRCCLGHGCYILGISRYKLEGGGFVYDEHTEIAPDSFQALVGLWDDTGTTSSGAYIEISGVKLRYAQSDLAGVNDDSDASPRQIGEYLLSVIEGGDSTPFRPLTDYPE